MKFSLIFLILMMTIGVNMPDDMISRLGVDPHFLLIALVAWVITGLIAHRRLALIVLVIGATLGANLPGDIASSLFIDRDHLTATLVALVITPYAVKLLD